MGQAEPYPSRTFKKIKDYLCNASKYAFTNEFHFINSKEKEINPEMKYGRFLTGENDKNVNL